MGSNAHIGFLAGIVDANDMNVDLQISHSTLFVFHSTLDKVGLVAGQCSGNNNRIFFHDTTSEVYLHKTTTFSIFANVVGELILTIKNVDVCIGTPIKSMFLIQNDQYLDRPTQSKLNLLSFSLSPSNLLLMTDCNFKIFVDQAGVNFNARAIQCPNVEIFDSTVPSDWRVAQRRIVQDCSNCARVSYVNEKVVSLVARGDTTFLLVSRQVYPCNRIADRSGLQRITQYTVKEQADFFPVPDVKFGVNGILLYGPSHKNIELFTDFPISTFADQNILLQIYWIKDILYITLFDLTLHKDSVYRVKDIRDVQKENNTCLPVQLDGHGLWIQCDNVLSYFRIDISTLSIKNVAERSINLNDHFSYRDFLLGARYKEGYVYTAELKKEELAGWDGAVAVQRYFYENGTRDATWRGRVVNKFSLSYLNHYQLALHETSSSFLFEVPHVMEHTFLNTRSHHISFLNVVEPEHGGCVDWSHDHFDANVIEKKHRILASNIGHHSFVTKKVVQIKNQKSNKKMKRDRTEL